MTRCCSGKVCPPWHSIKEITAPHCPPPSCPPFLSPSQSSPPPLLLLPLPLSKRNGQTDKQMDRHFCSIYTDNRNDLIGPEIWVWTPRLIFYCSTGRYGVYMIWLILLRWPYCFYSKTTFSEGASPDSC